MRWWLLVPCLGCGGDCFFGLGCFLGCVGMGGLVFVLVRYVGCMLDGMRMRGYIAGINFFKGGCSFERRFVS